MVYYSTEAVDRAIAANYESYLRMLEKSAPGAGWREVGLAVDGLPVFAAGRRVLQHLPRFDDAPRSVVSLLLSVGIAVRMPLKDLPSVGGSDGLKVGVFGDPEDRVVGVPRIGHERLLPTVVLADSP